jgi:hypothetical protein
MKEFFNKAWPWAVFLVLYALAFSAGKLVGHMSGYSEGMKRQQEISREVDLKNKESLSDSEKVELLELMRKWQ